MRRRRRGTSLVGDLRSEEVSVFNASLAARGTLQRITYSFLSLSIFLSVCPSLLPPAGGVIGGGGGGRGAYIPSLSHSLSLSFSRRRYL